MSTWKIGELARRTGLTVRALRHYGAVGLLEPSARSAAGYRLYGEADVKRLLQIVALRQLGLSLGEVRACLGGPGFEIQRVLGLHAERLRTRIREERRLLRRLEAVAQRGAAAEGVSADELLHLIEASVMFEKHYTAEQLEQLRARREQLGEDHIREVEAEWPRLIARVRACMERGADPSGDEMRPLAQRWRELVREFTGGDPGIARSLQNVYREEPAAREWAGLDPRIMEYIGRAMSALGGWDGGEAGR